MCVCIVFNVCACASCATCVRVQVCACVLIFHVTTCRIDISLTHLFSSCFSIFPSYHLSPFYMHKHKGTFLSTPRRPWRGGSAPLAYHPT